MALDARNPRFRFRDPPRGVSRPLAGVSTCKGSNPVRSAYGVSPSP